MHRVNGLGFASIRKGCYPRNYLCGARSLIIISLILNSIWIKWIFVWGVYTVHCISIYVWRSVHCTVGWSVVGGFKKKIGNSILPSDQKLFHIIKIKALNFFYSTLISSGAAIEKKKSKIGWKSYFLYWYPLKSMFENRYCQAKI